MRPIPALDPTTAERCSGRRPIRFLAGLAVAAVALALAAPLRAAEPTHGIAMHGAPALAPDFAHLPYANPDAPKGGTVTYGLVGTFDNLNPLIVKGTGAVGIRDPLFGNNVIESLLERNRAEPFSLYGLLAERVEMPDDRSHVTFYLNPKARFSDGDPVDVDDVLFSFETLKKKGRPNHRTPYSKVLSTERVGDTGIRFNLKGDDRELPLILGLMPVIPKHRFDNGRFDRTTLTPIVGSGPYLIAEVDAGTRMVLKRNPDYWGRDLPLKRGFDNFDEIRFDYYRDENTRFEAFKKGLVDVLTERDPTRWATGYDFPAVNDGKVVKDGFETGTPKGMYGFVFNTRRPPFNDPKLREAFGYLFDFKWINENLYFGLYRRTTSYFEGSELASTGRPASEGERALLAPFPGAVRADILEGTWAPPEPDGSGRDRAAIRKALALFAEAGWKIDGRTLTGPNGEALSFEITTATPDHERLALAYARTLKRIGIAVTVRTVDAAQYQRRLQGYDFDVILNTWASSLSPGNEQAFRWSSRAADLEGTFNFAGAREPALDAMIAAMLAARTRPAFVDAVRAFDRVLLSGFYVVPLFHAPEVWVARWEHVAHPDKPALDGPRFETWWSRKAAK
ncbi:peptide/nickel transport system substrate-binding protein [Rhodobium orientis]|uniref:ABC transporter substrate-binding protein n=1 Tax=Rhodobium orientis TaxID=34017 RepID=A0A327K0U8_9HYPH|nr:extracellular solute-binding protein [Rhodobium orientis]MBB4302286.1 peptide/nickel transport system substrate-binding protein [Rhodobium orientis]MBK5948996.1 ABC transporter substrate-binding protein [Rhodobium orientis]RAI28988.1 ABC transporter substrate-binding protein [Rhodobium orientis]